MHDDAARLRIGGRRRVERGLERGRSALVGGVIGPRQSWRRHLVRAQLARDALPRLRLMADAREVEPVEHEPRRLERLVVTGDAVAIENWTQCSVGRCRCLAQPRGARAAQTNGPG